MVKILLPESHIFLQSTLSGTIPCRWGISLYYFHQPDHNCRHLIRTTSSDFKTDITLCSQNHYQISSSQGYHSHNHFILSPQCSYSGTPPYQLLSIVCLFCLGRKRVDILILLASITIYLKFRHYRFSKYYMEYNII